MAQVKYLDRDSDKWRKLFARMSAHYLRERLPDNWHEMSDDALDEFFEEHAWQPFEYWPTDEVFDQIATVTDEVASLLAEPKEAEDETI